MQKTVTIEKCHFLCPVEAIDDFRENGLSGGSKNWRKGETGEGEAVVQTIFLKR